MGPDEADSSNPVLALFLRLLNTPDIVSGDSVHRLTAPLLSPPCPLRHPDFYRYICTSGHLANFEQVLGCNSTTTTTSSSPSPLHPVLLRTVCPQTVVAGSRPPFYPQEEPAEYPPLSLRSLLPRLQGQLDTVVPEGFQRLDTLMDCLLRMWEAFAGRRSWLGRQLVQIRSLYNQLRVCSAFAVVVVVVVGGGGGGLFHL